MNGLDIITVIAIILFARLGIRLYKLHKKYKAEKEEEEGKDDTHKSNGTL